MELSREEGVNILRSWGSGKNKLRFLARERLAHVNVGATIKEVSDDIDLDTAHDDFFHLSVKDATFARDDSIRSSAVADLERLTDSFKVRGLDDF